jgi:D-arabinose 5-phosphate isomerase GutQ
VAPAARSENSRTGSGGIATAVFGPAADGDVVLAMGAGSIGGVAPAMAAELNLTEINRYAAGRPNAEQVTSVSVVENDLLLTANGQKWRPGRCS